MARTMPVLRKLGTTAYIFVNISYTEFLSELTKSVENMGKISFMP